MLDFLEAGFLALEIIQTYTARDFYWRIENNLKGPKQEKKTLLEGLKKKKTKNPKNLVHAKISHSQVISKYQEKSVIYSEIPWQDWPARQLEPGRYFQVDYVRNTTPAGTERCREWPRRLTWVKNNTSMEVLKNIEKILRGESHKWCKSKGNFSLCAKKRSYK